jgi:D-arabinitol 2-dehydrogenase
MRSLSRTSLSLYVNVPRISTIRKPLNHPQRTFYESSKYCKDSSDPYHKHDAATTAGKPGESGKHEGQFARTDESIQVQYPEESSLPSSHPVQGRGGQHFKRTLASFSLEGRNAVVTGGARGLGLVMAQALVESGADVALVDLNGKE